MSADDDILKQLDAKVSSIQLHKSWREEKQREQSLQLEQEWQQFLGAARKLRGRLHGHPKLRYFSIARDESNVSVSFRGSGATSQLLSFYRANPEGKFETQPMFWCREEGRLDEKVTTARELNERLLRHCASVLAAEGSASQGGNQVDFET